MVRSVTDVKTITKKEQKEKWATQFYKKSKIKLIFFTKPVMSPGLSELTIVIKIQINY